jgi:hypothetical protein
MTSAVLPKKYAASILRDDFAVVLAVIVALELAKKGRSKFANGVLVCRHLFEY